MHNQTMNMNDMDDEKVHTRSRGNNKGNIQVAEARAKKQRARAVSYRLDGPTVSLFPGRTVPGQQ